MNPPVAIYLLLLLLISVATPPPTSATTIGVTYSTPTSISTTSAAALSPDRIAAKVVSMKIPAVRLLDSSPSMIRAFAYTNVSLFLSVPNPLVPLLASNRSLAMRWCYRHVLPFYPRTRISIISVGNDVVSYSPDVSPFLLRAMQNVHLSLADLRIYKISVSTTFSFFNVVPTAFPPSSAQFQEPTGEVIIRPILQFLERTNSSFLINLFPYNVYRSIFSIPVGFALFEEGPFNFRDDLTTGVRYRNLFDMMVDAVISSMAVMGHENLPVIVAETGWPSSGIDAGEVDATLLYSEMFLKALLGHLRSGVGTPLRKEGVAEVYVFELVEKEAKQGIRNWGLLHHNMTSKYSFEFSGGGGGKGRRFLEVLVGLFVEVVMLCLLV
ncbi:Glycosyl hydrolase superfamily protein [Raphanus sativus]|uniref:glucan endo-1,3-beta-D-glucosidase n=1 Tax=Raphanus sativus TaxID=3726 RepID=A0A6J0NY71_RAPSA|nr:glucan endo-1,3-beta-glucosidase 2 [Raphanus sativus]KAJ4895925.1 Glycosyl hydrolase superfamily protein [Raphanus sativus]